MPTSSTKNINLGACRVYFDGADLGVTQGGVEVIVKTDTHPINVDQFGKTNVNDLIMGRNVNVKCPLAETTLRNLTAVMPGSVLITDGARAAGTVVFAANPTSATIVTIGGIAFTFQSGKPSTQYQVLIGTLLADSMKNLVDVVNRAQIQLTLGGVTATLTSAGLVTLTAGDTGTGGNAIALTAASGAIASGATFLGGVAETKARVEVSTGVGQDLLSIARVLRLHPASKADSDFSQDFVVYLAATAGALTFAYKVDAERIYNIEFSGYPDPTGRMFSVGDLLA